MKGGISNQPDILVWSTRHGPSMVCILVAVSARTFHFCLTDEVKDRESPSSAVSILAYFVLKRAMIELLGGLTLQHLNQTLFRTFYTERRIED